MLRKAHSLIGFKIDATDGEIGHVSDFYFEDDSWTIRYLIVDTGPWIFGRKVLITPNVIQQPRWEDGHLPIQLTKDQIASSPDIDLDKPVSRQHELDIYTHYGWSPYWMPFPSYIGAPGLAPIGDLVPLAAEPTPTDEAQSALENAAQEGDPHLHSIKEVTGYHIQAVDDTIGHIEDFFIDEADWTLRYLLVDTQNWWPGKRVLIATDWVDEINWGESKVAVHVTLEEVKRSPEYSVTAPLERKYESALYGSYGLPGYWI